MTKPNLATLLETALAQPDAQETFGLKSPPDAKLRRLFRPGVGASQIVLDGWWTENEPKDTPLPPEPEDFGLKPALPTQAAEKPPEQPQGGRFERPDKLSELRGRVRVDDDATADDIIAAVLEGKWRRKAMMLTPLAGPILPWTHWSHMAMLRTQPWLGLHQETDSIIQRARNRCAQAFLGSEAEFSLWLDGDVIPPFGNAAFFYDPKRLGVNQKRLPKEFAEQHALSRLISHRKSIVGAVYQQRRAAGRLCIQPDISPKGESDRALVAELRARGPQDKVVPVEWCATGCLLVHRKVYEDIIAKNPDRAPKRPGEPFDFFGHDVGRSGEDAFFGKLAAEAGHQSFLDLGCWAGHLGNFCFMPEF